MKMLTKISRNFTFRLILATMVVVFVITMPIVLHVEHKSVERLQAANAQRERAAFDRAVQDLTKQHNDTLQEFKKQNDALQEQVKTLDDTVNTLQQTKSDLEQQLKKAQDDIKKMKTLPKGKVMSLSSAADQAAIQSGQAENWTNFTATAYTAFCSDGCTGKTSAGYDVSDSSIDHRVIAADPKVIPQYSIVEIEGQGYYKVLDTGGAIKGNKIDILMQSEREANKYGKPTVKLRIIRRGSGSLS